VNNTRISLCLGFGALLTACSGSSDSTTNDSATDESAASLGTCQPTVYEAATMVHSVGSPMTGGWSIWGGLCLPDRHDGGHPRDPRGLRQRLRLHDPGSQPLRRKGHGGLRDERDAACRCWRARRCRVARRCRIASRFCRRALAQGRGQSPREWEQRRRAAPGRRPVGAGVQVHPGRLARLARMGHLRWPDGPAVGAGDRRVARERRAPAPERGLLARHQRCQPRVRRRRVPGGHRDVRRHAPPGRALRHRRPALERARRRGRDVAAAAARRGSRGRLLDLRRVDVRLGSGRRARSLQRAVPLRVLPAEPRSGPVGLLARRLRAEPVPDRGHALHPPVRVERRRHAAPRERRARDGRKEPDHGRRAGLGQRRPPPTTDRRSRACSPRPSPEGRFVVTA
jgi:hypothetical protein